MTNVAISYDARLAINGEFVDAADGKTLEIINPATGGTIERVADADANDVNQVVEAAQRAFDEGSWSRSSIQKRARVLVDWYRNSGPPRRLN